MVRTNARVRGSSPPRDSRTETLDGLLDGDVDPVLADRLEQAGSLHPCHDGLAGVGESEVDAGRAERLHELVERLDAGDVQVVVDADVQDHGSRERISGTGQA